MAIKKAEFYKSAGKIEDCPETKKPEFAFIGRSNVGKSSLINMLCNHKGLAKTSSTPGKTQLINYFTINEDQWYLVDLPGYGYAKVSQTQRAEWQKRLYNYLEKRENLYCVFVLVDARIPPQKSDLEMINWLGKKGLPLALIYTKIDKIKQKELEQTQSEMITQLSKNWEEIPPIYYTSAETLVGKEEVIGFIEQYV